MHGQSCVAGVCLFLAMLGSAIAQTAGVNPDSLIIQSESGGDPTAQNQNTSANGLFQDVASTWASALADCGCGSISQYPTAASAPASVQIAANNALINQVGLSPWLCAGCDPAFAAAVAAAGGVAAFQTSGLPTDPATLAAADTNLAEYLASIGAGAVSDGGVTVTEDGTPASAIAGTGVAISAAGGVGGADPAPAATAGGGSFNPNTFIYNAYQSSIIQPMTNMLTTIHGAIQPFISPLMVIMISCCAIAAMMGRLGLDTVLDRAIRAGVVLTLVGVNSLYYETYVVGLFNAIPAYFAQQLVNAPAANPAAGFDQVLAAFNVSADGIHWNLPWGIITTLSNAFTIAVAGGVLGFGVEVMFVVWWLAQFLLLFFLVIGPIFVLALLFDYTRGWFNRWIRALLLLGGVSIVADIIASLLLQVIMQAFHAAATNGQTTQQSHNLFGVALVVLVMALSVPTMWLMLKFIFAAEGAPSVRSAAGMVMAPVRGAARLAAIAVAA